MTHILFGHKVEGVPQWSGLKGELVYLDQRAQLLWILLPKSLPEGENSAGLRYGQNELLYLGALEDSATDGRLAFFQLESNQLSIIEGLPAFNSLRSSPKIELSAVIPSAETLHDYIQTSDPDKEILRSVAGYASSHIAEIREKGLSGALKTFTFDDLARQYSKYSQRPIVRDPNLITELLKAVEARRLVFVLGGMKAGVSLLLEQFKSALPTQSPHGAHLSADFHPDWFKETHAFLVDMNRTQMIARCGCDLETTSLFIALAYAAYKSLLEADGTNSTSLAAFVPWAAADHPQDFALQYIAGLARHATRIKDSATLGSQVEWFLLFLGRLMEAAGKQGTLTVVLSFPGLTDWLRETRGQDTAVRVSRSLWGELRSFTNTNYDATSGQRKSGSVMSDFRHDVGVVVEIQRLSFPDVSEAFCRQSVLVMPPFSDEELRAVWRQRMKTDLTEPMLDYIRRQTGGAPWFVDMLFDCFDASMPSQNGTKDRSLDQLKAASELAKYILLNRTIPPPLPQMDRLRQRWMLYVHDLVSRMSAQTLTDQTTMLALNLASEKMVKMPFNVQAAEWLESGLIWLKSSSQKHTLTAFDRYPYILAFPQAELIALVINSLKSFRQREERWERVS